MSLMPVLLLKTRSSPSDAYEELLSHQFETTFVPVLQHRFQDDGMKYVRDLLQAKKINRGPETAYGGLIFTSQRAVEAFTKLVDEGNDTQSTVGWPHLQDIPIYSVGPATTRALRAVPQLPPLNIFGDHSGNGDALAQFILGHYNDWYHDRATRPALLFLVGEQRRDIIPKILMNEALAAERRIPVIETVVYGTGVMESFPKDFAKVLDRTADRQMRWVVVFSPTGCDSMLKGLGMLDGDGKKAKEQEGRRSTFIATIGPTTRDFLKSRFGWEPDVSAETPSPEGVCKAILGFIDAMR
ncbi:tetrapyrrole biosynthesis, uroporphyrinogen III synthase [Xylariaceae sp. FL0255]|nr:tetrapyrrole biosynthesis, uroporphyrinogen III synthase [Xylariaceae sp. FL0255]